MKLEIYIYVEAQSIHNMNTQRYILCVFRCTCIWLCGVCVSMCGCVHVCVFWCVLVMRGVWCLCLSRCLFVCVPLRVSVYLKADIPQNLHRTIAYMSMCFTRLEQNLVVIFPETG